MKANHYTNIAAYYEKWCEGDVAYLPCGAFYMEYLRGRRGVAAELGVGTGRIALPLSRQKGLKVYGVDNCPEMLAKCKEKMTPDADLELLLSDFLSFRLPEPADIIYMPFRTIGHILTDGGLRALLIQVNRNLKPGGLFLFDHAMFDRRWAAEDDGKQVVMYEDSRIRIVNQDFFDFEKNTAHCTVAVNGAIAEEFDFRWIEPRVIGALLPPCGFVCEKLYGDFDDTAWTEESPNQIWVLKKRAQAVTQGAVLMTQGDGSLVS